MNKSNNKEYKKQYYKEWYQKNREKKIKKSTEWNQAHKVIPTDDDLECKHIEKMVDKLFHHFQINEKNQYKYLLYAIEKSKPSDYYD
jgi:hypothetical protein